MGNYDFSGWATRNNLKCSDGRTIMKDAFKDNDGQIVPLVWNHQHESLQNVLGHALLKNMSEGVYAYCSFNDTEDGQLAKELVKHGDITGMSIYANQLVQQGGNVSHGNIRELSLVLATANPGAYIDAVLCHGDNSEEEWVIYSGEPLSLYHSDDKENNQENSKDEKKDADSEKKEKTVEDVFNELTEEQKKLVYFLVGRAKEDTEKKDSGNDESNDSDKDGGDEEMKHNVFDNDSKNKDEVLMHSAIIHDAIADAKRYGSMKESFLQHAAANNITDIDVLFPNPVDVNTPPEWIRQPDDWVGKIMTAVHHTPYARVRSRFATMDETEARARGYIKGKEKANIKLAVLKRTTSPTTVYIKMKMDRDDIVDITDFDVIAWQKAEMRKQLDRELALAMLLGDGRDVSSDDKIDEQCIRPVLKDDSLFTITYTVTDGDAYHNDFNSASDNDSEAKGVIRGAVKARKNYKGSGNPTFFTTEDLLTELLLIEDQNGRRIYESVQTLATAMRVSEIVTVPEMESHTDIYGIIVNMADYNTGADKGGAVSMFDDFDIDFNQQKYLMETRMSGALVRPYSAIVLKKETKGSEPGASGSGGEEDEL